MMNELLARTLRSIFGEYVKTIEFENGWKDDFSKDWSVLDTQVRTAYLGIIDKITEKLAKLPTSFRQNR